MTLTFTGVYNIDLGAEYARVNKVFKGKTKERQIELLKLFEQGKLNEWCETYNKLPYDKKAECSEKEYVGLYSDVIYDFMHSKFELSDVKITP